MPRNIYTDGEYLRMNPEWHANESTWKSKHILRILERDRLSPMTIGEVGCGTGEVLRQLQLRMDSRCVFWGYDISPQAIELSHSRQNERLHCRLGDFNKEKDADFDLLLILDVLEHVEDYFSFLREVKHLSRDKIFHFPLDLSAQSVLRNIPMEHRRLYGHLHYFTKELALQSLVDEGYEVRDWFYAPRRFDFASGLLEKVIQWPRVLSFAIRPDLTVRVLGGYTLFVLAK